MKKTKLLLPLISIGAISPIVPLVNLTSCNTSKIPLTRSEIVSSAVNALSTITISQSSALTAMVIPQVDDISLDPANVLQQVDVIAENLDGNCLDVQSATSTKPEYSNKLIVSYTIKFGTLTFIKRFTLYYNDVTTESKDKYKDSELKTCLTGLCEIDRNEFPFELKLEKESKSREKEEEIKFKLFCFGNTTDYVEIENEREIKGEKYEYEYQYKTKKGDVESEYSISITRQGNKALKIEVEKESESEDEETKLYFKRVIQDKTTVKYNQYRNDHYQNVLTTWVRTIDKDGCIVYLEE